MSGVAHRPADGARPTRQLILDEAHGLFVRNGYHGTSLRDITQAAGTSESLVYRHFASKEALYEQAVIQRFQDAREEQLARLCVVGLGSLEATVLDIVAHLLDFFERDRDLLRCLIESISFKNDPAMQLVQGAPPMQPIIDRIQCSLSRVAQVAVDSDGSLLIARACIGLVMAQTVLADWLFDDDQRAPDRSRAAHEITQLVLYGCTRRTARPAARPSAPPPPPRESLEAIATSVHPARRERVRPEERRRRSRHEVRVLLLTAARAIFNEVGYDQATTRAVAARAGVSETSLFRHFTSKQALFEAALEGQFGEFAKGYLRRWKAETRDLSSLHAQARDYVHSVHGLIAANQSLMRAALTRTRSTGLDAGEFLLILRDVLNSLEYQLYWILHENELFAIDAGITVRLTFGMFYTEAALTPWLASVRSDAPGTSQHLDQVATMLAIGAVVPAAKDVSAV